MPTDQSNADNPSLSEERVTQVSVKLKLISTVIMRFKEKDKSVPGVMWAKRLLKNTVFLIFPKDVLKE